MLYVIVQMFAGHIQHTQLFFSGVNKKDLKMSDAVGNILVYALHRQM